jgi:hypothetical protein
LQQAVFIAAVALVAAALIGAVVRRWVPEAAWVGVGVAIAVRVLLAATMAWSVVRLFRQHVDALRVAVAALLSVIGLWSAVVAVGMLYVVLFKRDAIAEEPRTR